MFTVCAFNPNQTELASLALKQRLYKVYKVEYMRRGSQQEAGGGRSSDPLGISGFP